MNLDVNGETIERSGIIKYLAAYMDEQLNTKKQIIKMSRKAMYGLYRLKQVRKVNRQSCRNNSYMNNKNQ